MSPVRLTLLRALICAAGLLLPHLANATVLDWSAVTWTNDATGKPQPNSYDVDPNSTGNDVTVNVTYSNYRMVNDPGTGLISPDISTTLSGGANPAAKNLLLAVGFAKPAETITVTISFSAQYAQGIQGGVSFSIFNIDKNVGAAEQYVDQITSISASNGVTTFAPTITNVGPAATLAGTGLTQTITGNATVPDTGVNSGDGNATINFSQGGITSITFTLAVGPGSTNNPTTQMIGLSNISYTPVPEMNPALAAAGLCSIAATALIRSSKRQRLRGARIAVDGERDRC